MKSLDWVQCNMKYHEMLAREFVNSQFLRCVLSCGLEWEKKFRRDEKINVRIIACSKEINTYG